MEVEKIDRAMQRVFIIIYCRWDGEQVVSLLALYFILHVALWARRWRIRILQCTWFGVLFGRSTSIAISHQIASTGLFEETAPHERCLESRCGRFGWVCEAVVVFQACCPQIFYRLKMKVQRLEAPKQILEQWKRGTKILKDTILCKEV